MSSKVLEFKLLQSEKQSTNSFTEVNYQRRFFFKLSLTQAIMVQKLGGNHNKKLTSHTLDLKSSKEQP